MSHQKRWACIVILAAHIALSLAYATSVPWWDSYDGPVHYSIPRYISLNRAYPTQSTTKHVSYIPQLSLYYALTGLAMSPIQSTDAVEPELNPGGAWRKLYIYDPQSNAFPYQGTAAAVFLGRLVSIALGTLAIACTWAIAQNLFPTRPAIALGATLLHAFWPLSTFANSIITNDIAVALAGSVALWLISRLVKSQRLAQQMPNKAKSEQKTRTKIWLALGLTILAGIASKNSGVALIGFGLPLAIAAFIRTCRNRPAIAASVGLGACIVAIAIYFFPFDYLAPLLYLRVKALRDVLLDGANNPNGSLLATLPSLIRNKLLQPNLLRYIPDYIFGIFGSVSLFMPTSWYQIARVSAVLPIVGLLIAKRRGFSTGHIWLLGNALFWVFFIAFVPSLLYNDFWQSFQARYFLPAWSALMLLIVIGLDSLPRLIRRPLMLGIIGSVCLVGLMTPVVVMHAAYSKPSFVADRLTYNYTPQMPTSLRFAEPGLLGMTDTIELFGVTVPQDRLIIDSARLTYADDADSLRARTQGQPILELDWRVLHKPVANYRVQVDGIGANGNITPLLDAIPGYGKFPTSLWTSGDQFRERIRLPQQGINAIRIQWLNIDTGQTLSTNCPQPLQCELTLPIAK